MSAFHLYTAYAIVPTQTLRPLHVAFVLCLTFLMFPLARRFRHRVMWWDWLAIALSIAVVVYLIRGGDDFTDRNTAPENLGHRARPRTDRAGARGDAPHHRLDHAGDHVGFHRLCAVGPVPAGAVDAQGLRDRPPGGRDVHDAGRHLRRRGRRVVVADHPVHHLRRVPAALGCRQVLHRLLVLGDGRQAHRRRTHRGAGVVSAGRAVGLGCGHHRHARCRGLPDAQQGGLRAQRGRRPARGRWLGRDHLAAGARRRGVPDRRVPEDLVPRRAADGRHPDAAVLPGVVPDGGDRCAQVRHARRRLRQARIGVVAVAQVLVPLSLAGVDRRFHDGRLFAGAERVLGHCGVVRHQHAAARHRATAL